MMTRYTKPDGTTTDKLDDCHDAWQQFVTPVLNALNEDDDIQMELMTGGPGGVALISPDYKRQVNLSVWFIRWLIELLDDRERLIAKLDYIAAELCASPHCDYCADLWQRILQVSETKAR
jgi:hypothetical protein